MSRTGTPHSSTITSLTSLLTLRTDPPDKLISKARLYSLHVSHPCTTPYAHCPMATSSPTCIPHQIPQDLSPRLHTLHLLTPLIARRHHPASHTPRGRVKPPNALGRGWITVFNGLSPTCKLPIWHCWEGPETTTGAYGNWCKPAHTVHVVNNFNFITLLGCNYDCTNMFRNSLLVCAGENVSSLCGGRSLVLHYAGLRS
jgi:hypothetical protein